ncbi:MAG: ATP-binding protein [Magnetococcales bacterium]|nr:ATP-binding protein [Magnetococcales bacterium]
MEDEQGALELLTAMEVANVWQKLPCVVVSGQGDGQIPAIAATHAICLEWIRQSRVSLAVAWPGQPDHAVSQQMLRLFYQNLARGRPIHVALDQARQQPDFHQGTVYWHLPALYTATLDVALLSHSTVPESASIWPDSPCPMASTTFPGQRPPPLPGRQRELRQLRAALSYGPDGPTRVAWVVGPPGSGRSALALRVADDLARNHRLPVVRVAGTPFNPITSSGMLQAFIAPLTLLNLTEEVGILKDASIQPSDRLQFLLEVVNQRAACVIVLDDLSFSLDHASQQFVDADLAAFCQIMQEKLAGLSRAMICVEQIPLFHEAPLTAVAPHVSRIECGGLPDGVFLSLLLCDRQISKRYLRRDISYEQLDQIGQSLARLPIFLPLVRYWLHVTDQEQIAATLADDTEVPFHCRITTQLVSLLSEQERQSLCRAAVLNSAAPAIIYAIAADLTDETLEESFRHWTEMGLMQMLRPGDGQREALWVIPAPLRHWLTRPIWLDDEMAHAAHLAAADFFAHCFEENGEERLGLSWIALLLEARGHYLMASEVPLALAASDRISTALRLQGFLAELERINWALLAHIQHPSPMNWIGQARLLLGDATEAVNWFSRARQANQGHYAEEDLASLQGLAEGYLVLQQDGLARHCIEEALTIHRNMEQQACQLPDMGGLLLHRLGQLEWRQGNHAAAEGYLLQALELHHHADHGVGEVMVLHELAALATAQSRPEQALDYLSRALAIRRQRGEQSGEAAALAEMGLVNLEQQQRELGLERLEQAVTLNRQANNRQDLASLLPIVAHLHFAAGNITLARRYFDEALPLLRGYKQWAMTASVLHQLATIDLKEGLHEAAYRGFRQSLRIKNGLEDQRGESASLFQLGRLLKERGDILGALRLMIVCLRIDSLLHHSDAKEEQEIVTELAESLGMTELELQVLQQETWGSYLVDRGEALLDELFP